MALLSYSPTVAAAILFGIQYVPVKRYETYDGTVFQFFMCCGALFATFWCILIRSIIVDGTVPHPQIVPQGILGGCFWAVSNMLVVPLVKLMGLGVGFSMYHVVNLMTGYFVGRLGLPMVGLKPDDAASPHLQDAGVAVLAVSLCLLIAVEPQTEPPPAQRDAELGSASAQGASAHLNARSAAPSIANSAAEPLAACAVSDAADAAGGTTVPELPPPLPPVPCSTDTDADTQRIMLLSTGSANIALARRGTTPQEDHCDGGSFVHWSEIDIGREPTWTLVKKLGLAAPLALAAGTACGLNAVPFDVVSQADKQHGGRPDVYAFALSHVLGVWITSLTLYLGWASVVKIAYSSKPPHTVMRPAMMAGCFWGIGNICMLTGIDGIGFAAGYALDAVGPVLVASVIAAILGEIRSGYQAAVFGLSLALQVAGVSMIAIGNGK